MTIGKYHYINIHIYRCPKRKRGRKGQKICFKHNRKKHGKRNRHPGLESTDNSKQDQSKEDQTKTHYDWNTKNQRYSEGFKISKGKVTSYIVGSLNEKGVKLYISTIVMGQTKQNMKYNVKTLIWEIQVKCRVAKCLTLRDLSNMK